MLHVIYNLDSCFLICVLKKQKGMVAVWLHDTSC